jgi:hypothetical protein
MRLAAVAVAVEEHSVVVLDEQDQLVGAVSSAQASIRLPEDASPLEQLPSARAVFAPYFERARRTGRTLEFVEFVDGRVVQVTVRPEGARLVVSWQTLDILDVLTLEGLRASIERVVETLAQAEATLRRAQARQLLRVVEGGE